MDTHITLLLVTTVLGVIAGAVALAWSLGAIYVAPLVVIGFFLAISYRAGEPEILARRFRWLLITLVCLALLSVTASLYINH